MLYTHATIYIYAKIEYLIREIIKKYFIYKEVIQNFQRCSAYFSVTKFKTIYETVLFDNIYKYGSVR